METLKKIYKFYKDHVEILLPLWGITFGMALVIRRIPYLNIYPSEILTILIVINWIIVMIFTRASIRANFALVLWSFVLQFVLLLLHITFYADIIADATYVILVVTLLQYLFLSREHV